MKGRFGRALNKLKELRKKKNPEQESQQGSTNRLQNAPEEDITTTTTTTTTQTTPSDDPFGAKFTIEIPGYGTYEAANLSSAYLAFTKYEPGTEEFNNTISDPQATHTHGEKRIPDEEQRYQIMEYLMGHYVSQNQEAEQFLRKEDEFTLIAGDEVFENIFPAVKVNWNTPEGKKEYHNPIDLGLIIPRQEEQQQPHVRHIQQAPIQQASIQQQQVPTTYFPAISAATSPSVPEVQTPQRPNHHRTEEEKAFRQLFEIPEDFFQHHKPQMGNDGLVHFVPKDNKTYSCDSVLKALSSIEVDTPIGKNILKDILRISVGKNHHDKKTQNFSPTLWQDHIDRDSIQKTVTAICTTFRTRKPSEEECVALTKKVICQIEEKSQNTQLGI